MINTSVFTGKYRGSACMENGDSLLTKKWTNTKKLIVKAINFLTFKIYIDNEQKLLWY